MWSTTARTRVSDATKYSRSDNIADSAHFPACRLKSIERWRHLATGRTVTSGSRLHRSDRTNHARGPSIRIEIEDSFQSHIQIIIS